MGDICLHGPHLDVHVSGRPQRRLRTREYVYAPVCVEVDHGISTGGDRGFEVCVGCDGDDFRRHIAFLLIAIRLLMLSSPWFAATLHYMRGTMKHRLMSMRSDRTSLSLGESLDVKKGKPRMHLLHSTWSFFEIQEYIVKQ